MKIRYLILSIFMQLGSALSSLRAAFALVLITGCAHGKISEVAVSSGTGASSCVLEGCPPASRCSLQPSGFGLGR
jgi:hypothetical protein